jgi:polyisoprenoid-binding protein YceI
MAWELDKAHSEVGFAVKHMMISTVKGKFTGFDATVALDPTNIEAASVEATIDVGSIQTGEEQRDAHLKSADFFDAETHPKIVFKSKSVKRNGGEIVATGDLTIKDTTKEITLKGNVEGPAKDPWGNQRVGFSLSSEIDREAFGLTWNQVLEAGGVLVGKKVKILVEAELIAK